MDVFAVLTVVARLFSGSVFLLAGTAKLGQVGAFQRDTQQYRLLPIWMTRPVAVMLPPFEVAVGLALFTGLMSGLAAVLAGALLILFLLSALSAITRNLNVSCACFGLLYRKPVTRGTSIRDVVLLAVVSLVVVNSQSAPNLISALMDITHPVNATAWSWSSLQQHCQRLVM